ncbi:MAG: recombinase family protein, partial [Kofleriaceae bacterium]
MNIRTYRRRSKNDEGKQQFSLDVQTRGCDELIARMELTDQPRTDYVDDGRAGDDFLNRSGLRALIAEAKKGDVIVCRDQSRLGRDAIEVTLVIRDLVRDRGCRLFYYSSGHEVAFANAIDQATTFIQGTGHQMELEAIRSRTREGLRSRVRQGRIAGGSCYGYTLERKSDGSGRRFTVAVVDDQQAPIVQRIYAEYLANRGLKAIAHQLNHEGVPSPSAGRRGSGSWASSAIRTILLNPRYRGIYMHGRIKKVQLGGSMVRVKADPHEIITIDLPEWRIVDDATWFAVAERFTTRGPYLRAGRPTGKYPLTGIAKCGSCGGAIAAARVIAYGGPKERVLCYGCAKHHERGSAVCAVTVHQPMAEVEAALVDHLQKHVLSEGVLQLVLAEIRSEIAAQLPKRDADVAALEAEVATARAEQRRLAKAVAMADEVPELITELKKRTTRIQHLEAQIIAARRTPEDLAALVTKIESGARGRLADLRSALADKRDLREVFLALFPDGLSFTPARSTDGTRAVWRIEGSASFSSLVEDGTLPIALRPRRALTRVGPGNRHRSCTCAEARTVSSDKSTDPAPSTRHQPSGRNRFA